MNRPATPAAALAIAIAIAIAPSAIACRLDPLVDDIPGASGHILPAGSIVPSAADSPELANQIALNDGVDDKTLAITGGVIPRGTGESAGESVRYWSFGLANRAPAPMFRFFTRGDGGALLPLSHPIMVESIPGERSYNPLHVINRVVVTSAYAGQLITTAEALADAIDLGLVEDPVPTGQFVASPVVLPGMKLEISSKPGVAPAQAELVYGHGYVVGMFQLGGARGVQPIGGFLPTNQVSFLRESNKPGYDAARPIFQATVPAAPPTTTAANYTPLSVVVNVDLKPNTAAGDILRDGDLFMRDSTTGAIVSTTGNVQQIQITSSILVLPIQFDEDAP